jgi:hypothetical protein
MNAVILQKVGVDWVTVPFEDGKLTLDAHKWVKITDLHWIPSPAKAGESIAVVDRTTLESLPGPPIVMRKDRQYFLLRKGGT